MSVGSVPFVWSVVGLVGRRVPMVRRCRCHLRVHVRDVCVFIPVCIYPKHDLLLGASY